MDERSRNGMIMNKMRGRAMIRVRRQQKHSHVMCTFLVLFVVLFLLMTTMFALEKRKQLQLEKELIKKDGGIVISKPVETGSPRNKSTFTDCTTEECIYSVTELLTSLDPGVDPCSDFYQYACGGWIKRQEIPKDFPYIDEWVLAQKKLTKFFGGFLENKEFQRKYENVSGVQKALQFYEKCTTLKDKDNSKGQDLLDIIQQYFPWPMIDSKWNQSVISIEILLATLSRDLNLNPFIDTSVRSDIKNSTNFMLNIVQTFEFGIFHRQFLSNQSFSIRGRKAYKELIHKMALYLGARNDSKTEQYVDEIFNVEYEIANSVEGYTVATNEEKHYEKLKIRELMERTEKYEMDWLAYFNELLRHTKHRVCLENEVVATYFPSVKNVIRILKRLPKRALLNYFGWKIICHVENLYQYVSKETYQIRKQFRYDAFGVMTFDVQVHCYNKALEYFTMALARVYVDKHFTTNSKQMAEEIASSISQVFLETLVKNDWMDFKTKSAAIEKVKGIVGRYGYPDYILDNNKLSQEYEHMKIHKHSLIKTVLSIISAKRKKELRRIERKNDRTRWSSSPLNVSPSYLPMANVMSFTAAFLQPPFYDEKYLRAVTYGGVGSIIGHELMHAFDYIGKSYDKHGNYRNWWTDVTLQMYKNKTRCLVDQYSSFEYEGIPINGQLSLSENIADNIGVHESFKAYQQVVERRKDNLRLPLTLFNNDQVFFLSYARNWCKLIKPENAVFEVYNEYAPSKFRVNGPLQNLVAFSKAFSCPVGSYMNPVKKCHMW